MGIRGDYARIGTFTDVSFVSVLKCGACGREAQAQRGIARWLPSDFSIQARRFDQLRNTLLGEVLRTG